MAKVQPELIHRLREMKGWSQSKLAQKAGIDAKTLSSVLNGKPYREDTISRIAEALGVTPGELLDGYASSTAGVEVPTEPRFEVKLVLSIPFEAVKTADGLSDLLRHISTLIDAKGAISVLDVKAGSVVLTLQMSEEDLRALILAAIVDDLEEIEFSSLTVLDEGFEMPFNLPHVLDADSISKAEAELRAKAADARKKRSKRKKKPTEGNEQIDEQRRRDDLFSQYTHGKRKHTEEGPKTKSNPDTSGDS